MRERVKAYSDIFIRYLFGSEGNEDIALDFINDVLQHSGFPKIKTVKILNPFNLSDFSGGKESILDIRVTDEQGKQYDIEVQSYGNEIYKHRSLYYWAKVYVSQIKEGDRFSKLKPVISINILNFTLIEEHKDYHNWFYLTKNNDPELILTDHLYIHFIELSKLREDYPSELNDLLKWLYFLRDAGKEDTDMKILIKNDDTLEKANKVYDYFTKDESLRRLYDMRIEAERKYLSDIEEAQKKGREEGIKEGKREGIKEGKRENKIEIAKRMKEDNIPINEISKYTGLSEEQISRL